ncbi:MAG TPA: helix-turn-helix domain-containing protein [Pyrinomonadaceae bacterium]
MSRFLTKIINQQPGEGKQQQSEAVQDSPSTLDRPSTADSPTTEDRLSKTLPLARPMDSPSIVDSPAAEDRPSIEDSPEADFKHSLPEKAGRLDLPHRYTDHACSLLSPDEQAVYLQLYRLSWGWGKDTCFISNPRLSERSNVPETTLRRVVKKLVAKKLAEILDRKFGSQREQGIVYRISKLDSPTTADSPATMDRLSAVAPNKVNTQKENTQTQAAPPTRVRVGSKFTLEECRRYAKHLQSTGQGINNPGGYATTIHRTGEADLLIESFLHPEAAGSTFPNLDTSQCPDCNGTGFYYPQGVEGGVARCKHERLRKGTDK